ncbi:uncharacterized protein EI97DRAFT_454350 [Westerdykella ornata]|uniref:Uncharacterized protein n=1 Tax=Westerdykella ornata TaxID=318751 RepID=A0A6A6JWZ0_WESOR|nr:uncharacterized protein EI97DRAFT_454350 [Westerdykella ornata]KAF2281131.1 hypothetical protein EI97DRAFT_454350 [Westerdykella ornata]
MCGQTHPYESQYCPKIKSVPTLLEHFNRNWYQEHAGLGGLFPWEKGADKRMQEHALGFWNYQSKSDVEKVQDYIHDDEDDFVTLKDAHSPAPDVPELLARIEALEMQAKKDREEVENCRVDAQLATHELKQLKDEVQALKAQVEKPTDWSKEMLELRVDLTKLKLATDGIEELVQQVTEFKREVHDLTFNKRRATDPVKHSGMIPPTHMSLNRADSSVTENDSKAVKAPSNANKTPRTAGNSREATSRTKPGSHLEFNFSWSTGNT